MPIFQMLIGTNIPFMKFRSYTYFFSGGLILATAVWLILHGGPKYSVDFTGGTLIQVRMSRTLSADQVRRSLDASGLKGFELQQMTGENRNEYLIRLKASEGHQNPFPQIQQAISGRFPGTQVELRRTEQV